MRRLASLGDDLARAPSHSVVDGVEVAYLYLLAVTVVLGWGGLTLGEFGHFSLGGLGLIGLAAAGAGYLVLCRAKSRLAVGWSRGALGLVPIVILGALLYTPPAEFIRGALDPGVYVNTGASIAQTGSIVIHDKDLAAMPPSARSTLFQGGQNPFADNRLVGFYVSDYERGEVVPHGFHLYPTYLAIAYALGGIWASLWATPIIALLGLVGFYLLARRLFCGAVAIVASAFLVANPGQIWFARYPAAENLVQLLLFGGLLAFVLMLDTGRRRFALLAGLSLGAVHLAKIEAVALPLALCGFFGFRWVTGGLSREHLFFLISYGGVFLHAFLHAVLISRIYAFDVAGDAVGARGLVLGAGVALVSLGVLVMGKRIAARVGNIDHIGRIASVCSAGLVLLLAGYAYYLRPRIGGSPALEGASSFAAAAGAMNRASYVVLGWYVSSMGLVLGPLGYATALVRERSGRTALILILAFVETLLFLSDMRITPLHFWAARRWLPVVFPAFALFTALFLWRLQLALGRRWPEVLLPAILSCIILISSLGGWLPFRGHTEYRGAVEQVSRLAEKIPDGAILLFADSDAGERLSAPLQFLFGHPSYILWEKAAGDDTANVLLTQWSKQGREVYLIRDSGARSAVDVARWGYVEESIGSFLIDWPEVLATTDRRPDFVGRFKVELYLYRVLPPQRYESGTAPRS